MKSRWYRYWKRHATLAAVMIVSGWGIAAFAQNVPTHSHPNNMPLDVVLTLAGGALFFMGIFGGISRWVAEPAARKVMAEHTNQGIKAHQEYIPREEWDRKHTELIEAVLHIKDSITLIKAHLKVKDED